MTGDALRTRTAVWDRGDTVYVAVLPRGPIRVLEGTAAVIWREASAGPRDETALRVAAAIAIPVEEIRADVDAFIDTLVDTGILPD